MLEAEGLQMEGQAAVMDVPLLGQVKKFPLAAAFFAAVLMAVHVLPAPGVSGRVPDNLGIRPHKNIITPALQLLSF